ncbi:MAG: restriction endonuclease subunit S [Accumulibacter sp.]|uniref:restriction endonuclease subunit S n=1 Tax=Accumulibacter sp. TaxID=2053492 RepID=UPI003314F091
MSSEWDEITLGEVVSLKTGKLDSNASEENGKFPFFTCAPQTLAISHHGFDTEAVILAGNNANGVFCCKHYSGKFNAYQRTYVIEPLDAGIASCRYIYFYISHMVNHLKELSVGSATKFLTKTILNALPIKLPKRSEQDRIAALLSALDDRITLLRETNATLEAIAQALFKSWFVDFDPVRAKQEGRAPEGMDEATAALFPDAFDESELGLVPRGWGVAALDSVADFLNGLALQKFPPENDDDWLPVIKIAQLRKGDTSGADHASQNIKSEYIVQNGDVLFSWSGSLEVEVWCGGMGVLNQHLFKVTSKNFAKWFYFLWTRYHLPHFQQIAAGKATTMGHIQRKHLTEAKVLVPPESLLGVANDAFDPLLNQLITNSLQAQTLATLRDTLLPRLISGQLRLPAANALLAEFAA